MILAPTFLFAFFGGFLLGYLIYDMMHYAMHHHNFKNPVLKKIKQHHMLHHYQDPTKGYGVSSSLWDIILNSGFSKQPNKS
jgi:sterol desaturase/sphingolipid hydroxylase (fatty acid hydroxylase superfamily)